MQRRKVKRRLVRSREILTCTKLNVMPESTSYTDNPQKHFWITVLSFLIALILFALCAWYVFGASSKPPEKNDPVYTSKTTSIKIDSTTIGTGKKIVIDTTIITKPIERTEVSFDETMNKRLSTVFNYFLLLFGVFIILAILPRLKVFNFNKDGVSAEFYEIAKAMNEAQSQVAQAPQVPQGGKTETEEMKNSFREETTKLITETGALDPQKGRWGGRSENNYRKLSAIITRITGSDWAEIILRVESTDPKNHPLKGVVVFHLHPTFVNPSPVIIVLDGVEEFKTKAWGAFTVGAVADGGLTTLELDLKEHPGSFEPFNGR